MSSIDLISMGVRNLIKRKLRTFLTVLGVMIGTASIVVMISLGLAINAQFEKQIEESGGDMTLIQIHNYNSGGYVVFSDDGSSEPQSPAPDINDETMAKIEQIPGVAIATPVLRCQMFFKSGDYILQAWECYGMKPEALPALGMVPAQGELLTAESGKYDVVFGAYAEGDFNKGVNNWNRQAWNYVYGGEEYFPVVDVMEDRIRMSPDSNFIWDVQDASVEIDPDDPNAPKPVKPYDANVVGLLAANERNNQYDASIFFRLDTIKELLEEGKKADTDNNAQWGNFSARKNSNAITYDTAYVKCTSIDVVKEVNRILTKEMHFETYYQLEWIEQSQEISKMLQMLLAAIGGVSLFVAAIGIANTMVMSIYERTREIGVMKVIGASIRDIKWLFLLESAMIGFFGGLTGVGLSLLVSYLLNNAVAGGGAEGEAAMAMAQLVPLGSGEGAVVSLITPWLCGVALGFSSLVGLFSGYFPARRATKLSALSAIRTE